MANYTKAIDGKLVRIPSKQEFAAFFKNYSSPDRNPWVRILLRAIYEGGDNGFSFNEVHKIIVRRGSTWKPQATAMKLNDLARMVVHGMDIPINTKAKKLFYSPFLVEFDYNWKTNGHVYLRPEIAKALEIAGWVNSKKRQPTRRKPMIDPSDPDSFLAPEGNSKAVLVRRIERSRAARNACIKKFGAICAVCGLCFGEEYGDEFEDLIQVHHLNPLGSRKARKTDFEKDLRPICPNCHAMAHWNRHKNSPRSIHKLSVIVKRRA